LDFRITLFKFGKAACWTVITLAETTLWELNLRLQSIRTAMATMSLDKTIMMPPQNISLADEDVTTMTQASTMPQEPRTPPPERAHASPTMMGISQELRREICEHVSKLLALTGMETFAFLRGSARCSALLEYT
jgi:hypothetical protein